MSLAGAPHAAAERTAAARLGSSTRSPTFADRMCGVVWGTPPSEIPLVSTRSPHAAASSLALTVPFPRSLPAPQVPAQQGLDVADLLVHEPGSMNPAGFEPRIPPVCNSGPVCRL